MARIPPIAILITARNEASAAINDVASSAASMGQSVSAAGNAIEAAQKKTAKLREELENARAGGAALEEIAQRAQDLDDHLGSAAGRAGQLHEGFEKIRNVGAGLAVAGAGALLLANNLIQVAEEGNAVEKRLESILAAQKRLNDLGTINDAVGDITARGHLPDDDPVREAAVQMISDQVSTSDLPKLLEAAARNAEALKLPIDQVGTLFAKAYGEGNLSRLTRANILFSDQEKAAVAAAYAISEAAGRVAFMDVVIASTARSTGELGSGLTESQKAANDAANAMDGLQTAVGTGATNAKAKVDGLTASLLQTAGANKEVAEGAGSLLYYGGALASGVGGVIAVGSQAAITGLALQGMGVTGAGAFAAISASAATAAIAVGAILIPLGLVLTAAAATYKAVQWTKEATTASDAEMEGPNASTRERFVSKAGRYLGNDTAGRDIATGNAAESQSAALFKKLRAKSSGEDPADLARIAKSSGAAPKALKDATTTPAIPGATTADSGATIASTTDTVTSKSSARSAKSAANAMAKAFKAAQSKREKEAKQRQSALQKMRVSQVRAADDTAKAQSEVAIAQIQADFDIRSAQIQASVEGADGKATARANYQIAEMEAAKSQRVAALRADGMKGIDELGRDTALKIGGIDAARKLTLAGMALKRALSKDDDSERDNGPSNALAAAMAAGRLKGSYSGSGSGGSMFGMRGGNYGDGPSFVGNNAAAMAAGISRAQSSFGNRGRGDGYENRDTAQPQLRATVMSVLRDALGDQVANIEVTFKSDDGMMSAARLLSN